MEAPKVPNYTITRSDPHSDNWVITNSKTFDEYSLALSQKNSTLINSKDVKVCRIKSDGLFTMKKKIIFQTPSARIDAKWSPKLIAYKLKATTSVKGYEQINWKWILNHKNIGLTLKDCNTGEIIASFTHVYRAYEEVGGLEIFKDNLPEDLKLFIASVTAYTFFQVFREVPQVAGWGI
ncbi:hypothetical protein CONCODRAFT_80306 [Conidiobolus coronatus NRRL 28638]|uniref:Uncharacterized protein n=1 Tax=Conidiobolus coronatus (strain ATCC 28846 / CBS 209.66 / NRRL 28638) TaxID=796925 RepID=A0A137NW02_CONC2|nr:hypothetical protein CONCODRAFT_80306 [Conidiobolus coronatus NRRL 28638]|eukprot:KXN67015.1 hypothetical protein CONCODRAFT_80306 [Conidiobolus coronatus NRRL 28638]